MGESGHSPALVGKHFIMNYYTILHDEPQSLYKFYKDDSVYSFGTEGEPLSPESTVTGQSNINEKIASLGFKKSKVHLSVMDAQPTLGGGVLLMVKGTITNETGNAPSPRKFVQTFLLAQQPTGYYVRNDILRYLAEESAKTTSAVHTQTEAAPVVKPKEAAETKPAEPEQPAATSVAAQQSTPATPVPEAAQEETKPQEPEQPKEAAAPAPAAVEAEPKETPTPVAAVTPAPAAAAKETPVPVAAVTPAAAAPSAAGKASPAAKPARAPQAGRGKGKDDKARTPASPAAAATETAAAAAPAAKAEPAPVDNSWAALAARKKDVPVTPLAAQPRAAPKVVKKAAPAAGDESSATGAATPAKEGETAAPAAEQSPAAPADKKVVSDPNSIYVSNLPFAAKQTQVTDAFKGFGKIVSVSMQNDKGYAFIEYDTVEAAHSAIKLATENPISMDGRVLRVEERKTKRGGSGVGGRKVPGGGRPTGSDRGDRVPRGPRPEGKDRAAGSPRPNGSDRRDRAPRSDKRAPGTGSPAVGRPAAGGPSSGGPPRRPAPAAATAASAPAAGGAAAGKK